MSIYAFPNVPLYEQNLSRCPVHMDIICPSKQYHIYVCDFLLIFLFLIIHLALYVCCNIK